MPFNIGSKDREMAGKLLSLTFTTYGKKDVTKTENKRSVSELKLDAMLAKIWHS